MEAFWSVVKLIFVCGTFLLALFMVLLAMPKSQLRAIVLEVLGWTGTTACLVLTVSPIDLVPDFVPVLGQIDDLLYIIGGIVSGIFAYSQHNARKSLP